MEEKIQNDIIDKRQDECIFCKISKGEIPAKKVYEDDFAVAFYDIQPLAKIHVVVIPKKHVNNILEYEDNEIDNHILLHMNKVIKIIVKQLGIDKTGFRVVTNTGKDAGQTVFHQHFHILGGENVEKVGM